MSLDIEDTIETLTAKLQKAADFDHIIWITPKQALDSITKDTLIEEQNKGVLQIFRYIKALLDLGYGTKELSWSVITTQTQSIHKKDLINPTHASIHGLIGSLAKEYPNWKIRLIDLKADCGILFKEIFNLPFRSSGDAWAYRDRQWYCQQLVPCVLPVINKTAYRQNGVYVIIGGSGNVGRMWTEYMLQTYQAKIIWIGRRPKNDGIQAKLDKLAILGPKPEYICADASSYQALQNAYTKIKRNHSYIHGIIHSAMVTQDQNKRLEYLDERQFKSGLSSKINVSLRIAQVFKREPLDFIVFFSSINSFLKAKRHSSYASGCSFVDAFAHRLCHELPFPVKVMNWGYWPRTEEPFPDSYKQWMAKEGRDFLDISEAMKALERLLISPLNQVAFYKTTQVSGMEGIELSPEIITTPTLSLSSNIERVIKRVSLQKQQIHKIEADSQAVTKIMEEYLCKLLWVQLMSIGLFDRKRQLITDLEKSSNVTDLYLRWLKASTTILAQYNYLEFDEKNYISIIADPIDHHQVWSEWEQQKKIWSKDTTLRAQVTLVDATLRALPDILSGEILATDIIFPNSSMALVEGIYKNNPMADLFNTILANTAAALFTRTT